SAGSTASTSSRWPLRPSPSCSSSSTCRCSASTGARPPPNCGPRCCTNGGPMSTTADDRLAAQVASELSTPEPAVHFGLSPLVASPVLTAAALGNRSVPAALALYLAALVVAWVLVGIVGGAFAMVGHSRLLPAHVDDDAAEDPSPTASADSVGSNSAH